MKCLKPLPEKWHGLQDVEQRYRQRYLDLIINSESKERFLKRIKMVDAIREFMKKRIILRWRHQCFNLWLAGQLQSHLRLTTTHLI